MKDYTSSKQMHPYVVKVRTVWYLDETHRPHCPRQAIVSIYYYSVSIDTTVNILYKNLS